MPVSLSPEDRTTAVGLFNYARSYWRSAEQLRISKIDVTHPDAPILFLFYHCIELYLKAYVRSAGYDLAKLRQISHKITKAASAAQSEGLVLSADHLDLLQVVDSDDNVVRARYITTGAHSRPEADALSSFSEHLDQAVGKRLIADGHSIRDLTNTQPLTTPSSRELGDRLDEEIESLSEKEREILAYLLHHNQRLFTCAADGGHAATLIARGIVRIAVTPGQVFGYDDMPVEIPREIWRYLRTKVDQFAYEADENAPYPWRKHWME